MPRKKKKVLVIFGTRPEAIKLAPLVNLLKKKRIFHTTVCVTSQHGSMLKQVLDIFKITPEYDLKIMKADQGIHEIVINSLKKIQDVLKKVKPDLVVLQGDTTTAFAAALAAFYEKIPIAHVEAGLRTNNKYAPFPEEINRSCISRLAEINFAPTRYAARNLIREGIPKNKIFITGNTAIDALFLTLQHARKLEPKWLKKMNKNRIILVTAHRRESFGEPFKNICRALIHIATTYGNIEIIYPVHLNPNVRRPVFQMLKGYKNIHLIEPLDYETLISVMNKSYLILTDSGGIQEEGPSLGKPILVMRNVTERPEGISAGVAKLVGQETKTIVKNVDALLHNRRLYKRMAKIANPYGDGKASHRIVKIMKKHLTYKSMLHF